MGKLFVGIVLLVGNKFIGVWFWMGKVWTGAGGKKLKLLLLTGTGAGVGLGNKFGWEITGAGAVGAGALSHPHPEFWVGLLVAGGMADYTLFQSVKGSCCLGGAYTTGLVDGLGLISSKSIKDPAATLGLAVLLFTVVGFFWLTWYTETSPSSPGYGILKTASVLIGLGLSSSF